MLNSIQTGTFLCISLHLPMLIFITKFREDDFLWQRLYRTGLETPRVL